MFAQQIINGFVAGSAYALSALVPPSSDPR